MTILDVFYSLGHYKLSTIKIQMSNAKRGAIQGVSGLLMSTTGPVQLVPGPLIFKPGP